MQRHDPHDKMHLMHVPTDKEVESVQTLPAAKRYAYYVKKAVGWAEAWALYGEGWATSLDDDGKRLFPLWPSRKIAELNAVGDWEGCDAERIEVVPENWTVS